MIDPSSVSVVASRWDFAQLDEWRRYLDMRLGIRGLISSDADEVANRVRYGVVDDETRLAVLRVLREIGVPCDLVDIEIRGYATPAGS